MDLQQRLGDYEVTTVPGRKRLRLLWSAAAVDDEPLVPEADEGPPAIALLASYRITRVPARAAS